MRAYVKQIAKARPELDARVSARADVVGSMIGLKKRAGHITGEVGICYFVRKKIPKSKLTPRQRVPSRVRSNHGYIVTDVVEWPQMEQQRATSVPTILKDGQSQGALTCFARSKAGLSGLTCAHCLEGPDGNAATPTTISYYDFPVRKWILAGPSTFAVYSPGPNLPGNFGYIDCGLFDLHDDALYTRASSAYPVRPVVDLYSLVGKLLIGISALRPSGFPDPARYAKVVGVEQYAIDGLADIVLDVEPPGTFRGDSGILWMTKDGRAAGIHCRGENMPVMQGSTRTTAMMAKRACTFLNIELLVD
ncbi:hypothetical protein [Luteimonas saliphila]|uniref:hypothetical protein n=1 Tax=Luteimonas saliphila TaxID=2804919 RepID=UPI00192E18AD|nr:hypothetical protein [Luteimonas saliphila]